MQKSTAYFPTTTYNVEENSILKIGEQEYQSILTYKIFIKENDSKNKDQINKHDVAITRTKLRSKNEKIDTKFLEIANRYMEALFPLHCFIGDYGLEVVNLAEIKSQIKEEDERIADQYSGEGADHIRTQFLNAVSTDDKLADLIKQLPLMKILNFGMQKFEKNKNYQLKWNILPIGFSEWEGRMEYSKDKNTLSFEPKINNAQEIMNEVIRYVHKNEYPLDFEDEEVGLFADFKQEIFYTGETGRMKNALTEVWIEVENKFLYKQKITLTNK